MPVTVSPARPPLLRTVWLLTLRDLKALRARSPLAPLWPGVAPLGQVLVIFTIAHSLLGSRAPHYFSALLLGALAWAHFALSVSAALPSIVEGGAGVRSGGIPLLALPLAAVLRVSITLSPYLLVAVLVADIDSGGIHPGWLGLAVVVQLTATAVLATTMALLQVLFRNARYAIDLGLQVGFYATPIILPLQQYPASLRPYVEWVPSTALVDLWRAAGLGTGVHLGASLTLAACVGVAAVLAWSARDAVMRSSSW